MRDAGSANSPPQPRRGGCAAKKSCEATLARADGVVLVKRMILLTSTTPAAATASAFPSSAEEGRFLARFSTVQKRMSFISNIHTVDALKRPPYIRDRSWHAHALSC